MEIFLPTLESNITSLTSAFRFIVFALMVIGLIAHLSRDRSQGTDIFVPLIKAVMIVSIIASQDVWFPKLDETFLLISETINPGYNNHPTKAADTVRESVTKNPEGQSWSWRKLNESLYHAFTHAVSSVFIFIGTLLCVPMLILQYVLKWLCYLIAPFALAVFMIPGCSSIGARFLQQTIAIHAWPVGFAVTDMVALSLWNDFQSAANPTANSALDAAVYTPLLTIMGALVATIIIIVGMCSTPVVMQKLFVQGLAFSGASASPVSIFQTASSLVRGRIGGNKVAPSASSAATNISAQNVHLPPAMGDIARPSI